VSGAADPSPGPLPGRASGPPPGALPDGAAPQVAPEGAVSTGEPVVATSMAGRSDLAPPSTGDGPVDEALEGLIGVLDRPLGEQLDVYAGVHRQLQDRLADLDG